MQRISIWCGSSITLVTSLRDKNSKVAEFIVAACDNSFYSIAKQINKYMVTDRRNNRKDHKDLPLVLYYLTFLEHACK